MITTVFAKLFFYMLKLNFEFVTALTIRENYRKHQNVDSLSVCSKRDKMFFASPEKL